MFEAPVFVWIAALGLILGERVTQWDVALRGQVFTINFLALLWLMAHALLAILGVI